MALSDTDKAAQFASIAEVAAAEAKGYTVYASQSEDFSNQAAASATDSATSATASSDSATAAANSATEAATSATSAATSEASASESVTSATNLITQAEVLGNIYPDLTTAQAAITAGTILDNQLFQTKSDIDTAYTLLWQNISGTPTAVLDSTGAQKTYPSGAAITDLQNYTNEQLAALLIQIASVLPGVGIIETDSSDYPFEVIDKAGRRPLGIDKNARTEINGGLLLQGVNILSLPDDSEYCVAFGDTVGRVAFGIGKDSFIEILGMRVYVTAGENILEVIDSFKRVAGGIDANGVIFSNSASNSDNETQTNSLIDFMEYLHIIIYGQSLSVGHLGSPILGTSAPDALMYNTGVISLNKTPTALIPLAEASVETIASGLAHGLVANVEKSTTGMDGRQLILNAGGVSGERIQNLSKGTSPYTGLINQILWCAGYLNNAGNEYNPGIMVWMQGEANELDGMAGDTYKGLLAQLRSDVNADILSVIGSEIPLQMFTYQTSSHGYYAGTAEHPSSEIPLAQLALSQEDANIHMVGPTYMCPNADQVHLTNYGYRKYGLYVQKAILHWLKTGTKWRPLEPVSAKKLGTRTVIVDFYVPFPPLVFDTTVITQLPDGNNGFELWDDSGRVPISATEIVGGTKVKITADQDLTGTVYAAAAFTPDNRGENDGTGHYPSWYSGPVTGLRTTLRDSDPETTDLLNSDGKPYPLQNYCVIFKMEAE